MSHHTLNYGERLRQQGYRLTPQRQLVLDAVCTAGGHAAINDILERVQAVSPAVNRATVYRALNFFCQQRLVVTGEINGKTIYEIAAPTPHHHLVCRQCGRVEMLPNHHFHDLIEHLVKEHHFQPEIDRLTIPGLCAACQVRRLQRIREKNGFFFYSFLSEIRCSLPKRNFSCLSPRCKCCIFQMVF